MLGEPASSKDELALAWRLFCLRGVCALYVEISIIV